MNFETQMIHNKIEKLRSMETIKFSMQCCGWALLKSWIELNHFSSRFKTNNLVQLQAHAAPLNFQDLLKKENYGLSCQLRWECYLEASLVSHLISLSKVTASKGTEEIIRAPAVMSW